VKVIDSCSSKQLYSAKPTVESLEENANARVGGRGLSLYPNPSNGIVTAEYYTASSGKLQIKVYDIAGRLVFTKQDKSIKGSNIYQVNLRNLKAGNYFLEITGITEKLREKFVIQN
jgi:hypothetical protein